MPRKIKLNKSHRQVIQDYGVKHITTAIDRIKEKKLLQAMLDGANAAIRVKYPENEMVILRKHNLTRKDFCLKFQFPSGRVDGFTFASDSEIADLPYRAGCYYGSNDVFPVTEKFEKAFDDHAKLKAANDDTQKTKLDEFFSFLNACQFIDDVLDVIPLPGDIRKRLGHESTALVAVTPETVKSLKATFKKAA
jgi:hypothetical protein